MAEDLLIWQKLNERLIKDGFRKVCEKRFKQPDGVERSFEIKKRSGSRLRPADYQRRQHRSGETVQARTGKSIIGTAGRRP